MKTFGIVSVDLRSDVARVFNNAGVPAKYSRDLFADGTLCTEADGAVIAVLPGASEVLMIEKDDNGGEPAVYYNQCTTYAEAVGVVVLFALATEVGDAEKQPALPWHEVGNGLEAVREASARTVAP